MHDSVCEACVTCSNNLSSRAVSYLSLYEIHKFPNLILNAYLDRSCQALTRSLSPGPKVVMRALVSQSMQSVMPWVGPGSQLWHYDDQYYGHKNQG